MYVASRRGGGGGGEDITFVIYVMLHGQLQCPSVLKTLNTFHMLINKINTIMAMAICNELGVSDQSHKTTRMTLNRVYSALRALENASCELALRPILYNIIQ